MTGQTARVIVTNFLAKEWALVSDEHRSLLSTYLSALPVRVGQIAKALGLTVSASTLRSGISGEIRPSESSPSGYIIRVNRHENKFRQRFTVAHEISHFLLHRDRIADGITDNVLYRSGLPNDIETQANKLAADILMPQHTLENWIQNNIGRRVTEENLPEISAATVASKVALKIRLNL